MENPISWQEAEKLARSKLEKEFGQRFSHRKMKIGKKEWKFDFVSEDGGIVAMVKSCQKKFEDLSSSQLETRFQRDYIFDCLLLERVQARRRIFFLSADKKLYDEFRNWSDGLILHEVDIRFIDAWKPE